MGCWQFWVLTAVAAAFGGLMLVQRSLYAAAVCLLVVLIQAGGIFLLAGAPLMAFLQMVIYAGAVMVLVVVAIMASGPGGADPGWSPLPRPLVGATAIVLFAELAWAARGLALPSGSPAAAAAAEAHIGAVLFGSHVLATEAAALLMFLSSLALIDRRSQP